MSKIKFYVDRKVSVWQRDWFETNEEEFDAVKRSIENDKYDPYEIDGSDVTATITDTLLETMEDIPLSEVNDSTVEMFMHDGLMVCTNSKL